jgi:hypothetical protein
MGMMVHSILLEFEKYWFEFDIEIPRQSEAVMSLLAMTMMLASRNHPSHRLDMYRIVKIYWMYLVRVENCSDDRRQENMLAFFFLFFYCCAVVRLARQTMMMMSREHPRMLHYDSVVAVTIKTMIGTQTGLMEAVVAVNRVIVVVVFVVASWSRLSKNANVYYMLVGSLFDWIYTTALPTSL